MKELQGSLTMCFPASTGATSSIQSSHAQFMSPSVTMVSPPTLSFKDAGESPIQLNSPQQQSLPFRPTPPQQYSHADTGIPVFHVSSPARNEQDSSAFLVDVCKGDNPSDKSNRLSQNVVIDILCNGGNRAVSCDGEDRATTREQRPDCRSSKSTAGVARHSGRSISEGGNIARACESTAPLLREDWASSLALGENASSGQVAMPGEKESDLEHVWASSRAARGKLHVVAQQQDIKQPPRESIGSSYETCCRNTEEGGSKSPGSWRRVQSESSRRSKSLCDADPCDFEATLVFASEQDLGGDRKESKPVTFQMAAGVLRSDGNAPVPGSTAALVSKAWT
jgi:hypothetical protein